MVRRILVVHRGEFIRIGSIERVDPAQDEFSRRVRHIRLYPIIGGMAKTTVCTACPVPWLDEKRGYLVDWLTQLWVRMARRRVKIADHEWLAGPFGSPAGIGERYFEELARQEGLALTVNEPEVGLVEEMPAGLHPSIAHFYQHTSEYDLELNARWCGLFMPFGWLIGYIFSRRLQQLNLPLCPHDTAAGIASDILVLRSPDGHRRYTGWLRTYIARRDVIYVGLYAHTRLPDGRPGIRVVFPLPNGNATVVLSLDIDKNGFLTLNSSGRGFGDAGFYFLVRSDEQTAWVRYLRAMKESIRVEVRDGKLEAVHALKLFGVEFLRMEYRLRKRPSDFE
jgi:hypothetical protein